MRRPLVAALLICLFTAQAGWSQRPAEGDYADSSVMPAGIQGQRIQSLIDTLNSGDAERVRTLISTACVGKFRDAIPMDEHVGAFLGFLRETGGIEFFGVRTYVPERPGETVVIVKDRNLEEWRGLVVRFGKGPDYGIEGLGFNPARPPKSVQEPPLTQADSRENESVGATSADAAGAEALDLADISFELPPAPSPIAPITGEALELSETFSRISAASPIPSSESPVTLRWRRSRVPTSVSFPRIVQGRNRRQSNPIHRLNSTSQHQAGNWFRTTKVR